MEIAIAGTTLPCSTLCHVVCTLVATGITNVTNSATTQTPPHQVVSLPEGYVAHSDIEVAYKVYDEQVTWIEARRRCIRDGARLALIDSTTKMQYVKNLEKSSDVVHVGIVRRYNSIWVDDTTGKELGALTWQSGHPTASSDCARMTISNLNLYNGDCTSSTWNYVCEIPIIFSRDNNRMTIS